MCGEEDVVWTCGEEEAKEEEEEMDVVCVELSPLWMVFICPFAVLSDLSTAVVSPP